MRTWQTHRNESLVFCLDSFELKKEKAPAGFGAPLALVSSEPPSEAMGHAIKNGALTLNSLGKSDLSDPSTHFYSVRSENGCRLKNFMFVAWDPLHHSFLTLFTVSVSITTKINIGKQVQQQKGHVWDFPMTRRLVRLLVFWIPSRDLLTAIQSYNSSQLQYLKIWAEGHTEQWRNMVKMAQSIIQETASAFDVEVNLVI